MSRPNSRQSRRDSQKASRSENIPEKGITITKKSSWYNNIHVIERIKERIETFQKYREILAEHFKKLEEEKEKRAIAKQKELIAKREEEKQNNIKNYKS